MVEHLERAVLAPAQGVFRAFLVTVVPAAAALEECEWEGVEALVESSLLPRAAGLKRRLRLFLRLVQWLPVLRYGRRFTALDPARRAAHLARLQDHRVPIVRLGFWGLRTLALLGYYGRPEAGAAIGYRPDPSGWEAWA